MADSIEGIVPIPADIADQQYRAFNFPWIAKQRVNHRREVKPAYQDTITVKAYGGAGFKIAGKWLNDDPTSGRLAGYWIGMNVPTCTLGHNVVLTNGVPRACELAVMYLKIWALEQGCDPRGVDALDFERMKLTAVTPTFLHDLGCRQLAVDVNREVRLAMELHNNEASGAKSKHRRALGVGTSYESTAYLHDRDRDITGYVKSRHHDAGHSYQSEDIRLQIFDEGETHLRLEPLLKGAWLKENQLDRPEDWRLYGGEGPYPRVYGLIRKALRLDENLRHDEPTAAELTLNLNASDQEIVRWHLAGGDAGTHPIVVGERKKLAQQKYLSDVKQRVLLRVRIDLSIPWARQKAARLDRLSAPLHYPGLYTPPVHLQDVVFSQHSVLRVLRELHERMARLRPVTLQTVLLDPRNVDPPAVKLGRLEISDAARRTLDKHRVPLHQLLHCHELGIWGSVSLEQVVELSAAAARGDAVTSKFPIFDKVVLICTDPHGVDGPVTSVFREDERPPTAPANLPL